MWIEIVLVIVGVALIVAGANFLTDGASAIAKRLHIPQIIIGLTIVAFGTSAPELVVSVIGSIEGSGGIAVGNVIGSNIFNVLCVLGACALIHPVPVKLNTLRFDLPIALVASILLMLVLSDMPLDGMPSLVSRSEALTLLLFGLLFLLYTIVVGKQGGDASETEEEGRNMHWLLAVVYLVGGLAGLVYGGQLFVENATKIASSLGVSETLIGLTLVAWGTSFPELATSVVAAMKGNTDIAVGNVIGSNIFNIFFVLGIAGTVRPLSNLQFTSLDIWMQLLAMVIALGVALFWGKREIKRAEGGLMLLVFILYNAWIIINEVG
ncbi:MAG: calcium/sodium antiporter [Porphyromonas somerae]|uniref:calcium/sodium antiporter n=1 Tax=Porphyromonas somerae TaxID=322095 RepID=UPI0026E9FBDD|nr:calcium/sodium antiporter [Porphyromonas somerae]MDD7558130.1 calcium/sodium antiporter [Porphyromonas somerae]MDY3120573.1 calcium/sodium antiporter [Porphyromonas somerae]MDY3884340.1 calcium/sodium antiporter [Porphyromonas somerae]MDY5815525.1 calcium/sodium antiporter [Porphyromonas somerae]